MTTTVRPTRQNLYDVYTFVVNNWAVNAEDIPGEPALVKAALKPLVRSGLVASMHVNGERKLTYQSMYDIENQPEDEVRDGADRDFNAAFPEKAVKTGAAHRGGTGPRYTDAQLEAGRRARMLGKTNREVAEAAGVKSPNYFAKTLRATFKDLDACVAEAEAILKALDTIEGAAASFAEAE